VSVNPFEPPAGHGPEQQDAEGWRTSHQQAVLADQFAIIHERAHEQDTFAGLWWDNTTDPVTIVLVVTSPTAPFLAEVVNAVAYPDRIRIEIARRSVRDLEVLRAQIEPDAIRAGHGIGIDVPRNCVVLILDQPNPSVEAALVDRWGDAVAFDYSVFRYAPRASPDDVRDAH
jgi:hypothetical protein